MHLSRLRGIAALTMHSLRPGDGKRSAAAYALTEEGVGQGLGERGGYGSGLDEVADAILLPTK